MYLRGVLGYLSDQGSAVLLDVLVLVCEARQHGREYLRLHHHLRQVHRVLGDLAQGGEYLPLQNGNKH